MVHPLDKRRSEDGKFILDESGLNFFSFPKLTLQHTACGFPPALPACFLPLALGSELWGRLSSWGDGGSPFLVMEREARRCSALWEAGRMGLLEG